MPSPDHSALHDAQDLLARSSDELPWLAPEQLATLAMPVLLMAGQNTPAIHAEIFRNVCAAMPQAEVSWIEASGHATPRDNAPPFNQRVHDFLLRCTSHESAITT